MSDEPATPADEATDNVFDPEPLLALMWDSLDETEQLEAYTSFWTCDEHNTRETRKKLLKPLAEALRFRPVFVERAPVEKKISFLKRVAHRKPFSFYRDDFLRAWLVEHRRPLLIAFLDGASVPHEDGFATEDEPPTVDQFDAGIAALAGRFGDRDIALYLIYLAQFGASSNFWDSLMETKGYRQYIGKLMCVGADDPLVDPDPEEEAIETEAATEGFTRIDDWLIRLSVSTAFGEENSPDEDTLEDIVEELVELNAGRHRSLFHRGFFHALFDREFRFSFPGVNAERRHWYTCGVVFGLLRHKQVARCIEILINEEKELGNELATSTGTPCGAKLLPQLLDPLLADGQYDYVASFVWNQFPKLPNDKLRASILSTVHREATRLLRQGRYPDAEGLIDLTMKILSRGEKMLHPEFVESLAPESLRRKAQCQQAKGSFTTARETLGKVFEDSGTSIPPNAVADLGLIEGGFRTLTAVLPKPDLDHNVPLVDALRKGAPHFENAVSQFGERATNAHLCLGILKSLESGSASSAQERADHFQHALGGMRENADAYTSQGIRDWAEFLLALALLETMENSNYPPAQDLIPPAISSAVKFPLFLWERMFEAASLFDDPGSAIAIAEHLMSARTEASSCLLANADLLARNEPLLITVLTQYLDRRNPVRNVWRKLVELLSPCLKFEALEAAELILDLLEELAVTNDEFRPELVGILSDSDRFSPAWEPADADSLVINLLEMDGKAEEAAEKLRGQFFPLKHAGQPHDLFAAREVIARLAELGSAGSFHTELEALLPQDFHLSVEGQPLSGHVLYVGGNETQKGYEERLRREIAEKHPDLELSFHFPGWSSNWGVQLEKLKPVVDRADVVVINPLVRTQFGRGLRAHCNGDHPWLPCTGRGYDSLKNAILRSAAWVAGNRG
jgi:hypothetical protein